MNPPCSNAWANSGIGPESAAGTSAATSGFIKLDVDGHGHKAHAGAAEAIRRQRPVILAGLHSPDEIDGLRALLDPLGYTWRCIDQRVNPDETLVGRDVLLTPRD